MALKGKKRPLRTTFRVIVVEESNPSRREVAIESLWSRHTCEKGKLISKLCKRPSRCFFEFECEFEFPRSPDTQSLQKYCKVDRKSRVGCEFCDFTEDSNILILFIATINILYRSVATIQYIDIVRLANTIYCIVVDNNNIILILFAETIQYIVLSFPITISYWYCRSWQYNILSCQIQ